MFAIIAAVVFLLALLGANLGSVNLVDLGLFFVALHLGLGGLVFDTTVRRITQPRP